jgi:hypothetical protein
MASLTRVAITSRKVIRYFIYLIIGIIFARATYIVGTRIYRYFYPAPPPPPVVEYGKLPALAFPEKAFPQNLIFTLQTPDLKLPKFPTQEIVYVMPQPAPNIRAIDSAQQTAQRLGFNPNGRELVETVYLFKRDDAPASLNMNVVSGIFSISYDLNSDPSALDRIPPTPEAATGIVKGMLQFSTILPKDLTGPVTTEFLKVEQGKFIKTFSQSDADVVKVNLFRKNYNDLPSVPDDPKEANVWFMVSGAKERGHQIIAGEYHYFPVDEEKHSTYPIKTAEEVWEELKAGHAYIASLGQNEKGGEVIVRRVYLAYYDAGQYTGFFQPVVVFEGDNDFAAYVPAVTNQFYGAE